MRKLHLGLVFILFSFLLACGSDKSASEATSNSDSKVENTASTKKIIDYNITSDPKTIDPQLNSATDGSNVLVNTFEGLLRKDAQGKPQLATAESMEVSDDKLTYTFKIRDNAKWSDGKAITSHDFEYAWKRALKPETAAEYVFQMFYIKNAQAYFRGETSIEEVGISAPDEKTLIVELESPVAYFDELLAFPVYFPSRKDAVEANPNGWAKDPATSFSNGPFTLKEYTAGEKIVSVKNEHYWNKDNIKVDGINFHFVNDENTSLTAFQNGDFDLIENVPLAELPRLRVEDSRLQILPYLGTYYYIFNVDKEPTDNIDVRKALTYAIDRKSIIEHVSRGGQTIATGMVPDGMTLSTGENYRETNGNFGIEESANVEKAKEHLAKAGYPDGEGFPTLTILYNTSEGHKAIAEAVQSMWKENLGIDVKLQNQEWAVFQDSRHTGNFEIARGGWIGDYKDPMTFLDLFTSYSGNNDAQWKWTKDEVKHASNKKFDELVEKAKVSQGTERDALILEAEQVMMEDMIVSPIYYYTNIFMIQDEMKGWEIDTLGKVYLGNSYFE